ncbi:MATE family efflux transporter [Peteryoungia desertarenae]|uniref:MATE family efflux transporter n=1 Tax=Peteryoungia desertarenae TaxID=1813451 RepID=A0ABX6QLY5_9HYPH|nr:MATE family efflux transporter [Peteryoungia desertarenae]QLF69292.1 MATE family efflux transporter [Peteryoungia desertarenae]
MQIAASKSRPFAVTHRSVLAIAVPMTLAFVTTPLLGLTDTAVVGRTGSAEALAGLAIAAVFFDLIFSATGFVRASTTALTAQALGRDDLFEQQAVFWRSFILSLGLGFLVLLLSPLLLPAGLFAMGVEGEVAAAASTYFTIRVLAAPLTLANFTLLGSILGRGRGTVGLGLQILLNGTNIVMSIWLGIGLDLGIAGVAWGTVIGESVAFVFGLFYVLRSFRGSERPALPLLLERQKMMALLAINRDIMIRSLALVTAFAIMTRVGASFGAEQLAANALLMNLFLIASFFLDGMATAAEQIAGRAVGSAYRPAFDRAVRLTMVWSFALGGGCAIFFLLFGGMLIDVMTTAETVRAIGRDFLPWAAATGLTGALAFQMDGVFIGATWSREMRNMMLISLASFALSLLVLVPAFGNHGLWAGMNLFLAMRGVTLATRLRRMTDQTFAASQ